MVKIVFLDVLLLGSLGFNKIYGKFYDLFSQIIYTIVILTLSVVVARTGFIDSPSLIWVVFSGFVSPFLFSRKYAYINIAYSISFVLFSFVMKSMGVEFFPMEIKNPSAFRLIAFLANTSFLSYFITSYVKSYYKQVDELKKQVIFNKNLSEVFNITEDYIGIAAPEKGKVIHNKSFVELTGIDPSRDDFKLTDFHTQEHIDVVLKDAFKECEKKGVWTGESHLISAQGEIVPVIQTLIAHYDEEQKSNRFSTIMKSIKDIKSVISEKEELMEKLLRTEASAAIGSWSLDLKSGELWWSDQTYILHELPVGSEVIVEEAINFYHEEDRDKIRRYVEDAIQHEKAYEDTLRLITAKGNLIWAHVIGRRYKQGDVDRLEGSFQDVSKQKQAEEAKSSFLSLVSHEMRTPLMSIIGFADIINDQDLNEDDRKAIDSIRQSGNTLLYLINDILDHAKYKNAELTLTNKEVDLIKLIKEVEFTGKNLVKSNDVEFAAHIDLKNKYVLTDEYKLKQVLTNLISNSVKFTETGKIEIKVNEKDNGTYCFEVNDSGIGMDKEFIPHLFDEFEQDHQSQKAHQGTGLGMSITKTIVNLFGGDIEVKSEVGVGTSFFINLKFEVIENIQSSKVVDLKNNADNSFENCHIVYADDNEMNRKVVQAMLKKTKANLVLLKDGQQLVDYYKEHQDIEFILTDVQMPILDGLAATNEIRKYEADNKLKRIPIVAFSAFSYEEDRQKAFAAGCDDTLAKPIKKKELLEKLFQFINPDNKETA